MAVQQWGRGTMSHHDAGLDNSLRARTRQRSELNQRHTSMMGLSNMTSAPKWSLAGRRNVGSGPRASIPDPGTYYAIDPGSTSKMQRTPNAAFGGLGTGRQELGKEKTPGPGSYSPFDERGFDGMQHAKSQSAVMLGTPRRREQRFGTRESTPDPGHYNSVEPAQTSKIHRSPSYGFASSRSSRFPELKYRAPGPGAYAHKPEVGANGPTANFLSSPRQRERKPGDTPEPGAYIPADPGATSKFPRSPRAVTTSTSTGRLGQDKESGPGPGTYQHQQELGEGPTTAIFRSSAGRKPGKVYTEVPDPGQYLPADPSDTSKMQRGSAYGFGGAVTGRFWEEESPRGGRESPGPGSYNIDPLEPSQLWGFGKSQMRPSMSNPSRAALESAALPGPGAYTNGGTIMGQDGPKFSMRARFPEHLEETPGPGAYGGHYTQFD